MAVLYSVHKDQVDHPIYRNPHTTQFRRAYSLLICRNNLALYSSLIIVYLQISPSCEPALQTVFVSWSYLWLERRPEVEHCSSTPLAFRPPTLSLLLIFCKRTTLVQTTLSILFGIAGTAALFRYCVVSSQNSVLILDWQQSWEAQVFRMVVEAQVSIFCFFNLF